MTPPGSSSSDPTATAAEELRWRLGALVSRHGDRLASDAEAWRACELELSAFYTGPYAVRTYALVQALKGGLVADLVGWHRDGVRGIDGEIAQRLTERSGVARPIAEWAVSQWRFAFALADQAAPARAAAASATAAPFTATGARPADAPAARAERIARTPRVSERASARPVSARSGELLVRVPHLVAAGVLTAIAVAAAIAASGATPPRLERLLGEAAAAAPVLPPAPPLETLPYRPAREEPADR